MRQRRVDGGHGGRNESVLPLGVTEGSRGRGNDPSFTVVDHCYNCFPLSMIIPSSPSGAMPTIFEIDEILRHFLSFCNNPSLAVLARTSKLFSELALDVLWEELHSFSHLLKLFGEDLITWNSNNQKPVSVFCS